MRADAAACPACGAPTAYGELAATAATPYLPRTTAVPGLVPLVDAAASGRHRHAGAHVRLRKTVRLPTWVLVSLTLVVVGTGALGAIYLAANLDTAREPAAVAVPGVPLAFDRPETWKVTDLDTVPELLDDFLAGSISGVNGVLLEGEGDTHIAVMHIPNVLEVATVPPFPEVLGEIVVTRQTERRHRLGPARDLVGRVDTSDGARTIQTTLVLTGERIVVIGALHADGSPADLDAFETVVNSLRSTPVQADHS